MVSMEVQGRIHNGVVILEGGPPWPEGTPVIVLPRGTPPMESPAIPRRVQLPLVRSERPGSRMLTAERLAEILDDEDVSA
jgi:hypothetical protein